jgi:hypothetical protein
VSVNTHFFATLCRVPPLLSTCCKATAVRHTNCFVTTECMHLLSQRRADASAAVPAPCCSRAGYCADHCTQQGTARPTSLCIMRLTARGAGVWHQQAHVPQQVCS